MPRRRFLPFVIAGLVPCMQGAAAPPREWTPLPDAEVARLTPKPGTGYWYVAPPKAGDETPPPAALVPPECACTDLVPTRFFFSVTMCAVPDLFLALESDLAKTTGGDAQHFRYTWVRFTRNTMLPPELQCATFSGPWPAEIRYDQTCALPDHPTFTMLPLWPELPVVTWRDGLDQHPPELELTDTGLLEPNCVPCPGSKSLCGGVPPGGNH